MFNISCLKINNFSHEDSEVWCCGLVLMYQQLMAEQQEEYISNTLLKKIEALKNEKEQLARNYEQEEEYLTNDLSRKLLQVSISVNCY